MTHEAAIDAVAYCHLGSSRAPHPGSDAPFQVALANGLLAHDPIWRATDRGIGALIGAGLIAGEPAPDFVKVHVLWAQLGEGHPSRHWPQFVAAYSDGLVDAWPNEYERERERAEREYLDWLDLGCGATFFVTVIETARPPFPEVAA